MTEKRHGVNLFDVATISIGALATIALFLLIGVIQAGWTVLILGLWSLQIGLVVGTIALACISIWLIRRMINLWKKGGAYRIVGGVGTGLIGTIALVLMAIAAPAAVFSLVRTYVPLDIPGRSDRVVILEIRGGGDTELSLYSGNGVMFRLLPISMPGANTPSPPFSAGRYHLRTVHGTTKLSYQTVDGGPFDAEVDIE